MRYRYLDLRRPIMQQRLARRHQVTQIIRAHLDKAHFQELETPLLVKSTPEGARDFIVPARQQPGAYYALPQSPQLFKQLLMVGGLDRYYQLARCFRDEDLRADRQPEFTQLDAEMSFVEEADVKELFEGLLKRLFLEVKGVRLPKFSSITYQESMERYGNDHPDLRWGMGMIDLTRALTTTPPPLFEKATHVRGLPLTSKEQLSRKRLEALAGWLKTHYPALTPLTYVKYPDEGVPVGPPTKWYPPEQVKGWVKNGPHPKTDLLLLLGGRDKEAVGEALGRIRLQLAELLSIPPRADFAATWVTDFPLLVKPKGSTHYQAVHHPFTAPQIQDIPLLGSNPLAVKARAYDLVINGVEIGGGSIRIHEKELQEQLFGLLGMKSSTYQRDFGFLLEALAYGAPPHGGIAFGLDRMVCMLEDERTIRDYIPFPKNNGGRDVMLGSPSPISQD